MLPTSVPSAEVLPAAAATPDSGALSAPTTAVVELEVSPPELSPEARPASGSKPSASKRAPTKAPASKPAASKGRVRSEAASRPVSSGSQAASEVAAEAPTASQAASAISKSADAGVQVKPAPEVASEVPKPAKPAKKPRTVASAAQPTVSAAAAEKASVDAKPKKPKKKEGVTPKHSERAKLVRDSFTMPEADFSLLAQMKRRSLSLQRETKKSELLRAGLQVLASMSDVDLVKALNALAPIKTGRPKKR